MSFCEKVVSLTLVRVEEKLKENTEENESSRNLAISLRRIFEGHCQLSGQDLPQL